MSVGLRNLPLVYQIAYNLGARIKIKHKTDSGWSLFSDSIVFGPGTCFKIDDSDENILKKAELAFRALNKEVYLERQKYFVPINALDGKTAVLFLTGFGVYAFVTKEGSVSELSAEQVREVESDGNKFSYRAYPEQAVFGLVY